MKIVNIKEKILTIFYRAGEQFQWTYDNIKSHKKQGFTPPSPSFSLSLYGEYVTYENENRRVIYLACIKWDRFSSTCFPKQNISVQYVPLMVKAFNQNHERLCNNFIFKKTSFLN